MNETAFNRHVFSCLLLLFVVHLDELVRTVITVDLASKLYTREGSALSLGKMISRPADAKRLNCSSLVSLYLTYLAVYVPRALPTIWFLIGYETMGRSPLSVIIYMLPMIVILPKYFEDVYGVDAVRLSFFFMNGSMRCGTYLMAVFFVLGTGLRIPLLCFDGPSGGVIMLSNLNKVVGTGVFGLDENAKLRGIARAGLSCLSNGIMWVVFVIYYHQCKKWGLEKKNDAVSQKNDVVPEKSNVASQKIDVESGGKVELNVNADEKLCHIEA